MCELNTRCNINTIVLGPMKANTCVTKTKGIYKLYRKSNPIPHANYKYSSSDQDLCYLSSTLLIQPIFIRHTAAPTKSIISHSEFKI